MKKLFSTRYTVALLMAVGFGLLVTSCDDDPIPLRDPNGEVGTEFKYTWAQTFGHQRNFCAK